MPNFDKTSVIDDFLTFIGSAPTAYHAIENCKQRLLAIGAIPWETRQGGQTKKNKQKPTNSTLDSAPPRCFYVNRGATLLAFALPESITNATSGNLPRDFAFRIYGCHSDYPTLKLKSLKVINRHPHYLLDTEPYGGILAKSVLDRDLGLAGQVAIDTGDGVALKLFDSKTPLAVVPSLAIHLEDRKNPVELNAETHLRPLLALETALENLEGKTSQANKEQNDKEKESLLKKLIAKQLRIDAGKIIGSELYLYPTEKSSLIGGAGDKPQWIRSRSLDNYAMMHAGLVAFTKRIANRDDEPDPAIINCLAIFNHEEIGSMSDEGAASFFLNQTLKEVLREILHTSPPSPQHTKPDEPTSPDGLTFEQFYHAILKKSLLLSADVAHAFHPNFPEKHSENFQATLGDGVAIKKAAGLRYSTSVLGEAIAKQMLLSADVPFQELVARADMPSGSTIGPILQSRLGITSIDLGTPVLSMHSPRETMHVADHLSAIACAESFFNYRGKFWHP